MSPGGLQPLLGGCQVIAIQDPHAVARQQCLALPAQFRDEPLAAACHMTDQFGGNVRLDVLEFFVDGLEGDRNTLVNLFVGRLNVRCLAADDQTHQINGGGEQ